MKLATVAALMAPALAANTDSMKQTVILKDGDKTAGELTYFTRIEEKDGKKMNCLMYSCKIGSAIPLKDQNDKRFSCNIATVTKKPKDDDEKKSMPNAKDRADWCSMQMQVKEADKAGKIEYTENKDRYKNDFANQKDDNRFNTDDDDGDKQNCVWMKEKDGTTLAADGDKITPTLVWMKELDTGDKDKDNLLEFGKKYDIVFKVETD
jgi:hypothetical protein